MGKSEQKRYLWSAEKWLCGGVTILLFLICWALFYAAMPSYSEGILLCVLYAVSSILLNSIYNAYGVGKTRVFELVYSQSLSNVIAAAIVYCAFSLILRRLPNVLPLFGLIAVQFVWSVLWCTGANKLFFKLNRPRKAAVVYETEADLLTLKEISYFDAHYDVQKKIRGAGNAEMVIDEIQDCEAVFVLGETRQEIRRAVAQFCVDKGVTGYITPDISEIIMASAQHMQMYSVPIMRIRRSRPQMEYLAVKRLIDIVCALAAGIIVSPIMIAAALAIKLYDKGPVFYRQTRLTKDGKRFSILKFRSMRVDAERDGVARLASVKDDRITPVGHIIRACRIDELPQLYNILVGDMTIVGPRPERPEIAEEYEKEMPEFSLRLQVKAGLTGLAQVYGRYNTDPKSKLEMDLMYINKMSLVEDLRLIFATVKILFMKESTAGVAGEQTTALRSAAKGQDELSA